MATFDSLPDEIHLNTTQNLTEEGPFGTYDYQPLHSFCLISRRYYQLALPMLYENVGRLYSTKNMVSFARTIAVKPNLALMVKSFEYIGTRGDEELAIEVDKADDVDQRNLQSLVLGDVQLHTNSIWTEVVTNDDLFKTMLLELILLNLTNIETLEVHWNSKNGPEYTYLHPEGGKIIIPNLKVVTLRAHTCGQQDDNDFVVMQPILAVSRPYSVKIQPCKSFWGRPLPSEGYSSVLQLSLSHCAMTEDGLQNLFQMFPSLQHFEYVASTDKELYGNFASTARQLVEASNTGQPRHREITKRLRSAHMALGSWAMVQMDRELEPVKSLHSFTSVDSLRTNQYDLTEWDESTETSGNDVAGAPEIKSKPFLHKLSNSLRSLRIDEADGTIKEELEQLALAPDMLPNLAAITLQPIENDKDVLVELQAVYRRSGRTLTLLEVEA